HRRIAAAQTATSGKEPSDDLAGRRLTVPDVDVNLRPGSPAVAVDRVRCHHVTRREVLHHATRGLLRHGPNLVAQVPADLWGAARSLEQNGGRPTPSMQLVAHR